MSNTRTARTGLAEPRHQQVQVGIFTKQLSEAGSHPKTQDGLKPGQGRACLGLLTGLQFSMGFGTSLQEFHVVFQWVVDVAGVDDASSSRFARVLVAYEGSSLRGYGRRPWPSGSELTGKWFSISLEDYMKEP